ncbi:hypothetical protein GCM10017750_63750 [Streptomyces racemochromogenes]
MPVHSTVRLPYLATRPPTSGSPTKAPPLRPTSATASSPADRSSRLWTPGTRAAQVAKAAPVTKKTAQTASRIVRGRGLRARPGGTVRPPAVSGSLRICVRPLVVRVLSVPARQCAGPAVRRVRATSPSRSSTRTLYRTSA